MTRKLWKLETLYFRILIILGIKSVKRVSHMIVIDSIIWYNEFRFCGSFLLDPCNLGIQQGYFDGTGYFTNCHIRSHHAIACWS